LPFAHLPFLIFFICGIATLCYTYSGLIKY